MSGSRIIKVFSDTLFKAAKLNKFVAHHIRIEMCIRDRYYIAAGMMFVCAVVVLKVLPNIQTNFRGKYRENQTGKRVYLTLYNPQTKEQICLSSGDRTS